MKYVKLYEQWKVSQKFGRRLNEEEETKGTEAKILSQEEVDDRKEAIKSFMSLSISAFFKANEQRQRQLFSNCINYTFDTVPMAEGEKAPFVKPEFKKEGKELQFIKSINSAKANWAKVRFTVDTDPETYGGNLDKLKNISCAALRLNVCKDDDQSTQMTIDLGSFIGYMSETKNANSFCTVLKNEGIKTALDNTEDKLKSITKLDKKEDLTKESYAKNDFDEYKLDSSNIASLKDKVETNITPRKKPEKSEPQQ